MADENKTEPATPRKRRKAREKGQVARSVEVVSAVTLLLVFGAVSLLQGYMGDTFNRLFRQLVGNAGGMDISTETLPGIFNLVITMTLTLLGPVLIVVFAAGLLSSMAQVGLVFSSDPITPKLDRINPINGFKRLFSLRAAFDTLKNLLKILAVAVIVVMILRAEAPVLLMLSGMTPEAAFAAVFRIALKIGFVSSAVLLILALLDYAYQRFEFEKGVRMSKREVKDEMKEQEGDPLIKRRLREFGRAIAFRRMMQRVKEADVVITNPTQYAVALLYEPEFAAPRIIAKGKDYMAERIRREAMKHGIPLYEDRYLAQALYRLEVDDIIPPALFQAVAQVLAFLTRVDEKLRRKLSSLRA
jgi:flagellar biosynthetic protein FlhB